MNPFVKALLLAVPAGALLDAAGAPLPWTIGPLLACALANLAGARLAVPLAARNGGQWMLGTVLGLYFTPPVFDRLLSDGHWIAMGVGWAMLLGLAFAWALRRWAGLSRATAFYGGAIGGATEMSVQGERAGGRVDQIAAIHSLRLVIVVLTLPLAYQLLELHGTDPYESGAQVVDGSGLAMLVASTVAAALAFRAFGWPNAWMLGPLAVALGLTASGHTWSAMPPLVVVVGQVLIGSSLGCRFSPGFFTRAPRLVAVAALCTVAGIGLSAGFAAALGIAAGLPVATLVLATTPGGIAEMTLTAKNLQLGVPVVTAFHVTRSVAMMTLLGTVYRGVGRLRGWDR